MKKLSAVLFLLLLSSAALAQLPDNERSLAIDEYNNVPKGLLLDVKPSAEKSADAAAHEAGSGDENGPKHMSLDTAQKLYRQGQFADALKGIEPLAKTGNPAACELYGVMLRLGQGAARNPVEAFDYLSKAANDNRALAQHHLGVMYYTGEGVTADAIQALSWLDLAILHYTDGPEKIRAMQDRDNVYKQMNRRDRDAAEKITYDFLQRKGEGHLMDMQ